MSKIFFLFLNFKFAKLFADLGHGIIEQTTGSLYFRAAHLARPRWGPSASVATLGIFSKMFLKKHNFSQWELQEFFSNVLSFSCFINLFVFYKP